MTLNEYRKLMIGILEMKARGVEDTEEYDGYYMGIMEAVETLKNSAFLTGGEEV